MVFNGIYNVLMGLMIVIQWDINRIYPLVNIQKAIENCHLEIVDLPIKESDFPLCESLPEGNHW